MFWIIALIITGIYYLVLIKIDRKRQTAYQIEQRAIPKINMDASFLNTTETIPNPTAEEEKLSTQVETRNLPDNQNKQVQAKTKREPEVLKQIETRIEKEIEKPNSTVIEKIEVIPLKEQTEEIPLDKSTIKQVVPEEIQSTENEIITIEATKNDDEELADETTIESNDYLGNELVAYQANVSRQQMADRIEPYKNQLILTELDIKLACEGSNIASSPLLDEETSLPV